jgi:hypothetical protein
MFRIAAGLVVGILALAGTAQAQQAAPAPSPFTFNADGGVILNFVKADKTADFEMVLGKLKEAIGKSTKPEHKTLAMGWKIFKAAEPGPNGAVIYVFIFDPAAKGGEYSVGNILVDAFGAEGQTLYKTYSDAFAMPAIGALLHLNKVADLGQ